MAVVGPKTVRHIAQLARLDLPEDRLAAMADDLSAILAHMESISDFTVDPAARDAGPPTHGRSDEITLPTGEGAHLIQSPTDAGEVMVPQVKDAS